MLPILDIEHFIDFSTLMLIIRGCPGIDIINLSIIGISYIIIIINSHKFDNDRLSMTYINIYVDTFIII